MRYKVVSIVTYSVAGECEMIVTGLEKEMKLHFPMRLHKILLKIRGEKESICSCYYIDNTIEKEFQEYVKQENKITKVIDQFYKGEYIDRLDEILADYFIPTELYKQKLNEMGEYNVLENN
jgi:hypothetical protein